MCRSGEPEGEMGLTKRSAGVVVQREVLDEQKLEDVTQRLDYNDRHPPLAKRLKQHVRYSIPFLIILAF